MTSDQRRYKGIEMAHRLGSGQKIEDLQAARAQWLAAGRTVSTFCSQKEWDAWQEDIGELIEAFADGSEIRQHATIKATSRGGSRKIVHNCIIGGNPAAYAHWLADDRPIDIKGWYPNWTYRHCRELAEVQARAAEKRLLETTAT